MRTSRSLLLVYRAPIPDYRAHECPQSAIFSPKECLELVFNHGKKLGAIALELAGADTKDM